MRRLWLLALVAAGALGGCGNSRTPVPSVLLPATPGGFKALAVPSAGLALQVPRTWAVSTGRAPVVLIASGTAVAAVWRYARSAPAPVGPAGLRRAGGALVRAARARDRRFVLLSTATARVGGAPAVEVDALERVGKQIRRVHSVHVFVPHAELVLDEYAPPQLFAAVDRSVFVPVQRSLLVSRTAA